MQIRVFFYFNRDILSFVSLMQKGNRSEIINGTIQFKVNLKHNKVVYLQKVKSCYNPLRLGTVIVLVSSGIDFVNTPRLYSDQATR